MYNGWVPEISRKQFLQNGIKVCAEQLKRDPENPWWENYRKQAQDKLDKIYEDEHADDVADASVCEFYSVGL